MAGWQNIRVGYRLILVTIWTLGMFAFRLTGLVFRPVARRIDMAIRSAAFRYWAKGILAIAGVRVRASGTPPKPPFFSVSNHLTNLDLIIIASRTGCLFVSRADIAQWPLIGIIARSMDTIFINRKRRRDTLRVNELIAMAMDRGDGVHVFAESRIAQDGQVHPFKPALLEPAIQRAVPVHYAALTYATPPGCPAALDAVVWRDGVPFARNVLNVLQLPYLNASITFGAEPIAAPDRKALAEALYEAVHELFVPLDSDATRAPGAPQPALPGSDSGNDSI
ncbi:MAG: 1-acyl-sn-glycerol-3-phosphate acyltransferase [Candidatus Hydrogenedentes bacterium]|nr:1-acyl-sn-glycerol-3-phosphate acyltransferase [Candidatus Hydrogenedentota bacterium]